MNFINNTFLYIKIYELSYIRLYKLLHYVLLLKYRNKINIPALVFKSRYHRYMFFKRVLNWCRPLRSLHHIFSMIFYFMDQITDNYQ